MPPPFDDAVMLMTMMMTTMMLMMMMMLLMLMILMMMMMIMMKKHQQEARCHAPHKSLSDFLHPWLANFPPIVGIKSEYNPIWIQLLGFLPTNNATVSPLDSVESSKLKSVRRSAKRG